MANTNKKTVYTRIQNKHDLEVNWKKATGFIPLAGELVIYDKEVDAAGNVLTMIVNEETKPALPAYLPGSTDTRAEPFTYARYKLGDGVTPINDLAFTVVGADNIYFDNDITITTPVGNIELSNGSGTIPAAGKNLKQVFEAIWTEESDPEVTQPSATISTALQYKEVGTTVTPSYTATLDPGSYEYGPATGVTATSWSVTFNGETKTTDSGSFNSITITEGACCSVKATASYTDGTIPVTNLGNNCEAKQIKAGSDDITKNLFTGYKPNFYGFKTEAIDLASLDSSAIRGLIVNQKSTITPVTSVKCSTSWMQFFYAVPKGRKASLSAKDSNNLPLTVNSKEVTVNHEGSASSTYTVFYINNDAAYGATTLALTWG